MSSHLKDVKTPDPIKRGLDKAFNYFIHHVRKVLGLILLALLIGGAWVGFQTWQKDQEKKWQLSFYKIEKNYLKKKESFEKFETTTKQVAEQAANKNKAKNNPAKKDSQTPPEVKVEGEKATLDMQKDYGSEIESLKALIQQKPDSQAALMSALLLSEIYSKYQASGAKPAEVLESFQKLKLRNDFLSTLVQFRKAVLLSDLGQCEKAIEIFKLITEEKNQEFLKPESLLKSALCFETLEKPEQAQEYYQKVIKDFANTSFSKEAQKFLRLVSK